MKFEIYDDKQKISKDKAFKIFNILINNYLNLSEVQIKK
jgi:hypothetical protein